MSVDLNNIDNVPEYLDFKFFDAALKTGFKEKDVKLKNVFFTCGPKFGENYCSQIYRANATYDDCNSNDNKISLILKCSPPGIMGEHFKQIGMFPHERDIYAEALNCIADILEGEDIAPKFLYFLSEPRETIVFEDVTPLGYVLADRVKGLDEDHCALVFRKLAKLHAASLVVVQKYPEIFEKFNRNIFDEEGSNEEFTKSFLQNFDQLADVCAKWPGFEETSNKLRRFLPTIRENIFKWMGPTDDELKVLIHNDLWTNNILFKYNDDQLNDLFFVDFQLTMFSSPGIDICHFLYLSPQYDVLEEKRDFLTEECYYKTFEETLKKLNYSPIPSLPDILEEIKKRERVGFIYAVMKLYLLCMNPEDCGENSLDNLMDEEKGLRIREIGMSSERYCVIMKHILRKMEKIGFLQ